MTIFMQGITYLAAILAGLVLFATVTSANGAPQEAAGAALALGIAIIPYCISSTMQRAKIIEKLSEPVRTEDPSRSERPAVTAEGRY